MENNSIYNIRKTTKEDSLEIVKLQQRTYPNLPCWHAEEVWQHIKNFPEGQLVTTDQEDRIVGAISALIIDWDDYTESAHWSTITDNGTFSTHNPLGKTLYVADICVDPAFGHMGIGSSLYEVLKKMVKDLGLKRILTGGRIPGYEKVSYQMTPKQYVMEVIQHKRKDPVLSFHLKNGFVVLEIISEYLNDVESRGYASLLEWLNPEYVMDVSLHEKVELTPEESTEEVYGEKPRPKKVRIACLQYDLRPISSFEDFATQVSFFVRGAKEYNSQFVLFPELLTMQLLSFLKESSPGRAVRILSNLTQDYENLFNRLALENNIYIIAGSHPVIECGKLYNAAHLFTPHGRVFRQKKVHLTPIEKNLYQMSRGHGFYVYNTDFGKIGILICYDIEFPEAARMMAQSGAEIIFIPSCTDARQTYCRIRYCAQARAIENQMYVALSCTVGNLPQVTGIATNYGQAAILTPSDYFCYRDGIAAEGIINQEQMVISDVDLDMLQEQRLSGSMIPLNDLIKDAYDRIIQYTDRPIKK